MRRVRFLVWIAGFSLLSAWALGCTHGADETDVEGAFESLTASASPSPAPPPQPQPQPPADCDESSISLQGLGGGKVCRSCYAACMAKGQLTSPQCYAICRAVARGGCHAAGDVCIGMPYPANDYCAAVLTPICGVDL